MDTQAARTQLEQMLRELDSATQTLESEGAGENSELSHITQHPADVASDIADSDREAAVLERADDHRTEVQAAIGRIDDGTYGVCVVCGKQIGEARLEIRPDAARCLEDQQAFEAARS